MTAPKARRGKRSAVASASVVALLGGVLVTSEYRAHYAYIDPVGALTVCEGLTGPWIVKGRYYSDAECSQRTSAYIAVMTSRMGHCVGPLNDKQWIAWGHFTYNVGTTAFCNSTAAKHLRAGNQVQACAQMKKWVYLTKGGTKVNCRISANRCGGIPKRRDLEYGMCMDAL